MWFGKRKNERMEYEEPLTPGGHMVTHSMEQLLRWDKLLILTVKVNNSCGVHPLDTQEMQTN